MVDSLADGRTRPPDEVEHIERAHSEFLGGEETDVRIAGGFLAAFHNLLVLIGRARTCRRVALE